jgi:hypothetical protein
LGKRAPSGGLSHRGWGKSRAFPSGRIANVNQQNFLRIFERRAPPLPIRGGILSFATLRAGEHTQPAFVQRYKQD